MSGRDIEDDNEILLNPDFASAHGILIGDRFSIEGKDYVVAGLCVRPDYIYAQKDTTDFYVNKKTFGQVTMRQSDFDSLDHTQVYYSIVYHKDNDAQVRQYLFDEYTSLRYLSSDANSRINQVREAAAQTILAGMKLCTELFASFIAELNVYIKPVITWQSMLICLGVLVGSYFISLQMLKRKAYRIDMVESLKDNRD